MQQLLIKAQAYCAATEHCTLDVQNKLLQWGAKNIWVESILTSLIKDKYLSNQRYAEAFVHDKLLYQGWGKMKLRYMLHAKQIDHSIVECALQTIDEQEYIKVLQHLISTHSKSTPKQLVRFLLQRGFSYDEIRSFT